MVREQGSEGVDSGLGEGLVALRRRLFFLFAVCYLRKVVHFRVEVVGTGWGR